ncbi:MAG: hypothetical protein EOO38_09315 [Cytophagaceae bacterium]|nr:MAG: hypothetical protein EOO38_09315 [Cytophagaceae bacterium]
MTSKYRQKGYCFADAPLSPSLQPRRSVVEQEITPASYRPDVFRPDDVVFLLVTGFYFPQTWVATRWRELAADCDEMLSMSEVKAGHVSAECEDDLVCCWFKEGAAAADDVASWRKMQAARLRWLGVMSVYVELPLVGR